jgi:hypothetical protein
LVRRIDRGVEVLNVEDVASLEKSLALVGNDGNTVARS